MCRHDKVTKRRAMMFFEFVSGLDHSFHIMSEATQDNWRHILEDIENLVKMFTYADEQQDAAAKKEAKKQRRIAQMELAFGIITAVFGLLGAGMNVLNYETTNTANVLNRFLWGQRSASFWQRSINTFTTLARNNGRLSTWRAPQKLFNGELIGPLQKQWTIASAAYLGLQGLTKEVVKEINHKKDIKGFEKTLSAVEGELALLDTSATEEAQNAMQIITTGGTTRDGHNIVHLYRSLFFYGSNVGFRAWASFMIEMRSYATIVNALWKTEGVYIVESLVKSGDCDSDDRGPADLKVCLTERPERSYWVYAISNYDDKKLRAPPGLEYLNTTHPFHGIWLQDVVRSSLWWVEVHRPSSMQPEWVHDASSSSDSDTDSDSDSDFDEYAIPAINITSSAGNTTYLDDYGNVPGTFRIPICHSWNGEAISSIKSKHKVNGPCLCDAMNPQVGSFWEQANNWTTAATKFFVKEGGFFNFNNYGKICGGKCDHVGSWASLLGLGKDDKPAKHMKKAWGRHCHAKGWKHWPLGPAQLVEEESTTSSSAPAASGTPDDPDVAPEPPFQSTPTRDPIVQATTELLTHETRYPKNTPKNITRQGDCNGPYCIVDAVYKITEQHYEYTVDASVRPNDQGCFPGDLWCFEQSAHDLCEWFEDEDEMKAEAEAEANGEEEEEVGSDEDEYADFIQDDETPDTDGTPGGNSTSDGTNDPERTATPNGDKTAEGANQKDPASEKTEGEKALEAETDLANRRAACFCPGVNGTEGQPGINCSAGKITTKTTTIKGRMKQTVTPLKPFSSKPTASGGAGGAAGGAAGKAASGSGNVVYHWATVTVEAKRDVLAEVLSLAPPTEVPSLTLLTEVPSVTTAMAAPMLLTGSFSSFAAFPTLDMA
ncbi:hypothetical protein J4E80_007212 [Alternaria sp. BMP 0032]|nr:hypothetical protein J4E80_007212 [Alternaria sp. BMP 0032]